MEPATGLPATHMPVNLQQDGQAPTTAESLREPGINFCEACYIKHKV